MTKHSSSTATVSAGGDALLSATGPLAIAAGDSVSVRHDVAGIGGCKLDGGLGRGLSLSLASLLTGAASLMTAAASLATGAGSGAI